MTNLTNTNNAAANTTAKLARALDKLFVPSFPTVSELSCLFQELRDLEEATWTVKVQAESDEERREALFLAGWANTLIDELDLVWESLSREEEQKLTFHAKRQNLSRWEERYGHLQPESADWRDRLTALEKQCLIRMSSWSRRQWCSETDERSWKSNRRTQYRLR